VVGALAGATIGVPVLGVLAPAAVGQVPFTGPTGPSTAEILASPRPTTPTTVLAPLSEETRTAQTVSRSLSRLPLPTCDGIVAHTSGNGEIPADDLCTLWDGTNMLRGDAAVALTELNDNFKVAMGHDLCVTDSYRTLGEQRRLKATKGGLAATPGTSNHGWGLAVDLCGSETHSKTVMSWLKENGPTFGWDNPAWARSGGSGPHEPWHWEYVPGTVEMGTNWD
jgi:hypothetical protein